MSGLSEILKRPTEMSDVSGASPVIRTVSSSRLNAPNVAKARSNPFFNIDVPRQVAPGGTLPLARVYYLRGRALRAVRAGDSRTVTGFDDTIAGKPFDEYWV